jgi:hypothetical protein
MRPGGASLSRALSGSSLPLPPLVELARLDRVAASAERLEVRLIEEAAAFDEGDLVMNVGGGEAAAAARLPPEREAAGAFPRCRAPGLAPASCHSRSIRVCVSRHADAMARAIPLLAARWGPELFESNHSSRACKSLVTGVTCSEGTRREGSER